VRTPAPRLSLAHTPTPLSEPPGLASLLGGRPVRIFVKHDDMTGGVTAGNKIRKLEYLLAEARARHATTVITCGGLQSNHARATAVLARSLGMNSVLLLRTKDAPGAALPTSGNVLLDRMVGAEIRLITPDQYRDRSEQMAVVAREIEARGGVPYVIPEGGSNALGSLGYVRAMVEIARQLELGLAGGQPFDLVAHACGSGGTAAGVVVGAAETGVAAAARAFAVCDDVGYFQGVIGRLVAEMKGRFGLDRALDVVVDDSAKGPAYGVASDDQKRRIVEVARATGLLLDPVYTGKAFLGLCDMARRGELDGKRVLFLHTGGLPGLLADGAAFERSL
jgi:D-cysteine desulfhydrase